MMKEAVVLFCISAALILSGLKLTGDFTGPWWAALSPLWVPLAWVVLNVLWWGLVAVAGGCFEALGRRWQKRQNRKWEEKL